MAPERNRAAQARHALAAGNSGAAWEPWLELTQPLQPTLTQSRASTTVGGQPLQMLLPANSWHVSFLVCVLLYFLLDASGKYVYFLVRVLLHVLHDNYCNYFTLCFFYTLCLAILVVFFFGFKFYFWISWN